MFYPGKVENWVVLVNLGDIGYVPYVPIKVNKLIFNSYCRILRKS